MVYIKPCPEYDKHINHHNKLRCAEFGVCLHAYTIIVQATGNVVKFFIYRSNVYIKGITV